MQKLILGSAQFGLNYGINNKNGKIKIPEVFKILDYAISHGIKEIDTATAYGNAQQVIGEYLRKRKQRLKIITKCSGTNASEIENEVNTSLSNLGMEKIHGLLIHKFDSYKRNKEIYKKLIALKREKCVDKIGFSLYFPKEAEYLLKQKIPIDILEIPYNLFDRRFEVLFKEFKRKKIKIYARSIFLQGLFFKKENELGVFFKRMGDRIKSLNEIAYKNSLPLSVICLNFVQLNKNIDKILVGVDSLDNLKENAEAFNAVKKVKRIYNDLLCLKLDNEKIILPINWEKT